MKYQHQLVIGNLLNSRKTEIVLVSEEEDWIRTEGREIDIESLIIPKCVKLHQERMAQGAGKQTNRQDGALMTIERMIINDD